MSKFRPDHSRRCFVLGGVLLRVARRLLPSRKSTRGLLFLPVGFSDDLYLHEPGTRLPLRQHLVRQPPVRKVHHHRRLRPGRSVCHCLLVPSIPGLLIRLWKPCPALSMVGLVIQVAARRKEFLNKASARRDPAEDRVDMRVRVQLRISAQPVPPFPVHQEEVARGIAVETVGRKGQPRIRRGLPRLRSGRVVQAEVVFLFETPWNVAVPGSVRAKQRMDLPHMLRAEPELPGKVQTCRDFLRQVAPIDSIEAPGRQRRPGKPPDESRTEKQVRVRRQQELSASPADPRILGDVLEDRNLVRIGQGAMDFRWHLDEPQTDRSEGVRPVKRFAEERSIRPGIPFDDDDLGGQLIPVG